MTKRKITIVGGGTGTHTVLSGLKRYKNLIDISAVVTMADSGGSTGKLRDEFGYLPVGDVRMALSALAKDGDEDDQLLRKIFLHRFDKGSGLSGHSVGNLLLVALTDILGSEELAIKSASRLLGAEGTVIPVTTDRVNLVAEYSDGSTLEGEHLIDLGHNVAQSSRISSLSLKPAAQISGGAKAAILSSDLIVLGPGDLYTSVLANCVVTGTKEAFDKTQAKLVYVSNLMTKRGQTDGFCVTDHVNEIENYIGRSIDHIIVNDAQLPADLVKSYEKDEEYPVALGESDSRIILSDLLANEVVENQKGDVLKRSLIRHDPGKLAKALLDLVN